MRGKSPTARASETAEKSSKHANCQDAQVLQRPRSYRAHSGLTLAVPQARRDREGGIDGGSLLLAMPPPTATDNPNKGNREFERGTDSPR